MTLVQAVSILLGLSLPCACIVSALLLRSKGHEARATWALFGSASIVAAELSFAVGAFLHQATNGSVADALFYVALALLFVGNWSMAASFRGVVGAGSLVYLTGSIGLGGLWAVLLEPATRIDNFNFIGLFEFVVLTPVAAVWIGTVGVCIGLVSAILAWRKDVGMPGVWE